MKRLLAVALVSGGLAVTAVPAPAAPLCGPVVDVNCWNGARYCRIYVAPRTCVFTA